MLGKHVLTALVQGEMNISGIVGREEGREAGDHPFWFT